MISLPSEDSGSDTPPFEFHHLQFVDDTTIFCEASENFVKNLKTILRWFELYSSLHINYLKSEIFDTILSGNELSLMASLMECHFASLPSSYLGLPLCIETPSFSLWEPVIVKFNKRLASWRGKYLSFGGRITLLKSVLSALLVYFLSTFQCPKKVIISFEKIMREFLWGSQTEKEKDHLVS